MLIKCGLSWLSFQNQPSITKIRFSGSCCDIIAIKSTWRMQISYGISYTRLNSLQPAYKRFLWLVWFCWYSSTIHLEADSLITFQAFLFDLFEFCQFDYQLENQENGLGKHANWDEHVGQVEAKESLKTLWPAHWQAGHKLSLSGNKFPPWRLPCGPASLHQLSQFFFSSHCF